MGKHMRKLFSADQVKEEFRRYLAPADRSRSSIGNAQDSKGQFFKLLKLYRDRPESFSLQPARTK